MKGKKLFCLIISLQLLAIIFLILFLRQKISPKITYSPLPKESVLATQVGNLKSFFEPTPNTLAEDNPWMPYRAKNTINADSLNERYDYSPEKISGVFRIVTLGDSWTYGLYVDTQDNWSEKLEDKLNSQKVCDKAGKYEVINLGVGGYDLQYAIERFKLRGAKYSPDIVLWLIKSDDYGQVNELILPREQEIGEEMRKTGEFEREVKAGINYPSWFRAYAEFAQKYNEDDILSLQREILATFDKDYKNPIVFLTFPTVPEKGEALINWFMGARPNTYFYKNLVDVLADASLQFPTDKHPNPKGHGRIAEDLFKYLSEQKFLPCP